MRKIRIWSAVIFLVGLLLANPVLRAQEGSQDRTGTLEQIRKGIFKGASLGLIDESRKDYFLGLVRSDLMIGDQEIKKLESQMTADIEKLKKDGQDKKALFSRSVLIRLWAYHWNGSFEQLNRISRVLGDDHLGNETVQRLVFFISATHKIGFTKDHEEFILQLYHRIVTGYHKNFRAFPARTAKERTDTLRARLMSWVDHVRRLGTESSLKKVEEVVLNDIGRGHARIKTEILYSIIAGFNSDAKEFVKRYYMHEQLDKNTNEYLLQCVAKWESEASARALLEAKKKSLKDQIKILEAGQSRK